MQSLTFNRRQMLLGTRASLAGLALTGTAAAGPFAQESKVRSHLRRPDTSYAMVACSKVRYVHPLRRLQHHRSARMGDGNQAIPVVEYAPHAATFNPVKNSARAWAKLAKAAGMKYMVMTTKHHEGFCNFDSKLTDYCAGKQGPGRDLVREYVDAARAEGLHVGFYYSLMDWHHPDGARCANDEVARKRFVEYTHGLIREILTNYGKIDVLWYDVSWPLDANGWESERMNKMVFELQPDIIVNNRNKLPGDFSTPEQRIVAETGGRAWESCMTLNDSWGYQRADDNWKSSKTIIRNLISCVPRWRQLFAEHRPEAGWIDS